MLANAAVQILITALLFAPGIAFSVVRRPSAVALAAGGALSLVVVSGVEYLVASAGYSPVAGLRVVAVLLALTLLGSLVVAIAKAVRRRRWRPPGIAEWAMLAIAVLLGIWVLGPSYLALHAEGLRFGLVGSGNSDQPNYALAALNIAQSGFHDSHHVANMDMGSLAHRQSYIGSIAVLNFVASTTSLSQVQALTPTMGVAVTVMAVGLWSLGRAVWPESRRAVALAVGIACVSALTVFSIGLYFLGAIFGVSAVAMSVAGAIEVGRRRRAEAVALLVFGSAWGIYAYGFMQLPLLVVLPFVTLITAALTGLRGLRPLSARLGVGAFGVAAALFLALPTLGDVLHLLRMQGDANVGFPLEPLSSLTATVWPQGFDQANLPGAAPMPTAFVVGSWVVVLVVLIVGLAASWRAGRTSSALLGALTLIASVAAVVLAIRVFGGTKYQNWKFQSFLAPLAAVAVLPAVASGRAMSRRLGTTGLAVVLGATLLAPALLWQKYLDTPKGTAGKVLPAAVMRLKSNPKLRNVSALNVRLPSGVDEMGAGAVLESTAVVFTSNSLYPKQVSLTTCTLTLRTMVRPKERDFTSLGDGYVLLNRPSTCARTR